MYFRIILYNIYCFDSHEEEEISHIATYSVCGHKFGEHIGIGEHIHIFTGAVNCHR